MRAVSFDPGGTTGWCKGVVRDVGPMYVTPGQEKFTHLALYKFLCQYAPDHIICEQFDYRNKSRKGLSLISKEFIGVIELYVQQAYVCDLTYQPPNTIVGYFTDQRLKRDKMWIPGKGHAADATRHLLHWYQFGSGYQYWQEGYERAS